MKQVFEYNSDGDIVAAQEMSFDSDVPLGDAANSQLVVTDEADMISMEEVEKYYISGGALHEKTVVTLSCDVDEAVADREDIVTASINIQTEGVTLVADSDEEFSIPSGHGSYEITLALEGERHIQILDNRHWSAPVTIKALPHQRDKIMAEALRLTQSGGEDIWQATYNDIKDLRQTFLDAGYASILDDETLTDAQQQQRFLDCIHQGQHGTRASFFYLLAKQVTCIITHMTKREIGLLDPSAVGLRIVGPAAHALDVLYSIDSFRLQDIYDGGLVGDCVPKPGYVDVLAKAGESDICVPLWDQLLEAQDGWCTAIEARGDELTRSTMTDAEFADKIRDLFYHYTGIDDDVLTWRGQPLTWRHAPMTWR